MSTADTGTLIPFEGWGAFAEQRSLVLLAAVLTGATVSAPLGVAMTAAGHLLGVVAVARQAATNEQLADRLAVIEREIRASSNTEGLSPEQVAAVLLNGPDGSRAVALYLRAVQGEESMVRPIGRAIGRLLGGRRANQVTVAAVRALEDLQFAGLERLLAVAREIDASGEGGVARQLGSTWLYPMWGLDTSLQQLGLLVVRFDEHWADEVWLSVRITPVGEQLLELIGSGPGSDGRNSDETHP